MKPEKNPQGPREGMVRVVRGDGWLYGARYCRAASRDYWRPVYRNVNLGFRLAFLPPRKGGT